MPGTRSSSSGSSANGRRRPSLIRRSPRRSARPRPGWRGRPWRSCSRGRAPPVFGTGDGNIANYLWDGTKVRVIDFEYSGRSDRAFELAEVTEHIAVWENDPAGMTAVLERLELTAGEAARLTECRRLMALFWLLRVRKEIRSAQADRMLALLQPG
ncbi:phosphotransferase family protein [Nonomuraea sp. NPDC049400]|uniref:phosphotransferase family protein n=1 Tax=Nonomuraea sp. NPDC049400 TaxID=3364352 RepID=UPI00379524DA